MRARFLILLAMLVLLWVGVASFDPRMETYAGMCIRTVAGKPYLILEERANSQLGNRADGAFSIYVPTGSELSAWRPVLENRSGIVLGTFEIPPQPAPAKPE